MDTVKFFSFDADDIADCARVVHSVAMIVSLFHGSATVRRLFSREVASRRELKKEANLRLMVNYVGFQLSANLSANQCAKMLAEKNKSLPWGHRYGAGSTKSEVLVRQIRREKKRMKANVSYRKEVESLATDLLNFGHFRKKNVRADISKQIGS